MSKSSTVVTIPIPLIYLYSIWVALWCKLWPHSSSLLPLLVQVLSAPTVEELPVFGTKLEAEAIIALVLLYSIFELEFPDFFLPITFSLLFYTKSKTFSRVPLNTCGLATSVPTSCATPCPSSYTTNSAWSCACIATSCSCC